MPAAPGKMPRDLLPSLARSRFVLAALIVVAIASAIAAGFAILVGIGLALDATGVRGPVSPNLPRLANVAIIALPVLCWLGALLFQRRNVGRTFRQQIRDNRWASLLMVIALVGVLASVADIIAAGVVFEAEAGLLAAGIAAAVGVLVALVALAVGRDIVTWSVHAGPIDDERLTNVATEVSLAAGLPMPRLLVLEDGSINAFAVGSDPTTASIVVTRGLLDRLDREQLQGVVAHELAHIRNGDSRYGLFVAILIGLVVLLTDGFLRVILEAWKQGAFFRGAEGSDDAKGAVAGLVGGLVIGVVLLLIALLLRVFAPLFATLVQAAVSRERELLADATAVELTRNPLGLERALETIASDRDVLAAANRGTQHLWFVNPVKAGSDGGTGLLATHPSIEKRIARLRLLRGEGAVLAGSQPPR
jgi:heat shock protein HtpX